MALDSIYFPAGKSANILRGRFGAILAKISPEFYSRIFEPASVESGPSGIRNWPRPFVFRAAHLDAATISPESKFHFDFHFFEMRVRAFDVLKEAFAELGAQGLGPSRGKAELESVSGMDRLSLSLDPGTETIDRVAVRFLTPTELKMAGKSVAQPEFPVLASRIRDRVSTLRELYDDGPLKLDFRGFGERAAKIRMRRCDLHRIDTSRRSSRTGQVHSIGGFSGEAEYEGDLSEFMPYLRAAQWTGVGRHTTWGNGALTVMGTPNSSLYTKPDHD